MYHARTASIFQCEIRRETRKVATVAPQSERKVFTTESIRYALSEGGTDHIPAMDCSLGKAIAALNDGHMIQSHKVPAMERRSEV